MELENCSTSISDCKVTTKKYLSNDENINEDSIKIVSSINNIINSKNPGWYFEQPKEISNQDHMSICLELKEWVKLKIKNKPCLIKATFATAITDIVFFEYEKFNVANVDQNKFKLIEAVIKESVIDKLDKIEIGGDVKYCLSRMEIQYG